MSRVRNYHHFSEFNYINRSTLTLIFVSCTVTDFNIPATVNVISVEIDCIHAA